MAEETGARNPRESYLERSSLMPNIRALLGQQTLCPRCETYRLAEGESVCRYCEIKERNRTETPEQLIARLREQAREQHAIEDAWRQRFPVLVGRATDPDRFDQEKENEWDGVDERIYE